MSTVRSRRRARGQAALAALAVCGMLALTACRGGDGPDAPGKNPGTAPTPAATASGPAASALPSPVKSAAKPSATATATPAAKKPTAAPTATCDHKMPIAPDLIALYRYTPEGGDHNLIVKHGNWGCAAPGSAGAHFEPVGTETFIPIAETAKITATAPVITGSESKPVTLHELISWLDTHPDAGLPFRYHLRADGFIDTLDEVYLP
ncbi:hypothetical protein [Streptomyces sp. NPDC059564]|uniref:hypothetical protein n=1 Tax=Streptomyces sp. NPDC059564 TaxID=3346865 RepID=UPI0036A8EC44